MGALANAGSSIGGYTGQANGSMPAPQSSALPDLDLDINNLGNDESDGDFNAFNGAKIAN